MTPGPLGTGGIRFAQSLQRAVGNSTTKTLDVKTDILYHEGTANSTLPDTSQGPYSTACADEPYESLIPVTPWSIGKSKNPR